MIRSKAWAATLMLLATMVAAGCGEHEDPVALDDASTSFTEDSSTELKLGWGSSTRTYEVTLTNLTSGQPFSPPVAATHRQRIHMFRTGRKASPEIEAIAEDGNDAPMIALLEGLPGVTDVVGVGMPLTPMGSGAGGFSDEVKFMIEARPGDRFSFATMLICTNDGFLGLDGVRLPWYGHREYYVRGYDAGTENNTERSMDIVDPCSALGPIMLAGDDNGNENDAVATKPPRRIRRHRGIDGDEDLSSKAHDWKGAVAKVKIRRVQQPARYRVTIENLTDGQPFSPPVVATHQRSLRMFQTGHLASPGLEAIAEDGNQIPMFNRFDGSDEATQVVDVGRPLTRNGTTFGEFTDSVEFEIEAGPGDRLSMAMMLICTNDGFTGLDAVRLPRHGRSQYWLKGYDAGTEDNTEESSDIVDACSALGPVPLSGDDDGNENDAVATKPPHPIRRHPGISGKGELSEKAHGWENPVARVTVERL